VVSGDACSASASCFANFTACIFLPPAYITAYAANLQVSANLL
tara:strand:- start:4342 stop:4470 length:129 start_codon:yes stop_codon:yes gene_type:complete